jgi:uncharacterized protein
VRVTIQPRDAPPAGQDRSRTIEQIGSDEMLLFATDYPHRHPGDLLDTFLRQLPERLAHRIRHENARALYGLPVPATAVH